MVEPASTGRARAGSQLARSPVEFLGDEKSARRVPFAKREGPDAALLRPRREAALEVAFQAGGGLVALLGRLGEHDDPETGPGTVSIRLLGANGCRKMWQCTHSIRSDAENGSEPVSI